MPKYLRADNTTQPGVFLNGFESVFSQSQLQPEYTPSHFCVCEIKAFLHVFGMMLIKYRFLFTTDVKSSMHALLHLSKAL